MEVALAPEAVVQGVFKQMTFALKKGEVIIGTGQPLPGNVIDFGNAAVLAAGVEKAQMIVNRIDHLAEQFQAEKKALN